MKRRNGFTLIELLAIIVILAIIAVITVPLILGIIDNAKEKAVTDSAYGYKDAVNKMYTTKLLNNKDYKMEDRVYTISELNTEGVSVSGKEPDSNSWIQIEDNNVKSGCLQFDEYKVDITNGEIVGAQKSECEEYVVRAKPIVYSNKGDQSPKVVSDPLIDLSIGDYVTVENEGFYVISINSSKVIALADTCLVEDNGNYRQKISTEDNSAYVSTYFSPAYWCSSDCQVLKNEYAYDLNGNPANFSGNPYPYVYYVKGSDNNYVDDIVDSYVETLSLSATGRLLSYEEAKTLDSSIVDVPNASYWLGSAKYAGSSANFGTVYQRAYVSTARPNYFFSTLISNGYKSGVRPVIEMDLSNF